MLLDNILVLHKLSVDDYGGAHGIRDLAMLESAVQRPFQTFDRQDLYASVIEKAAAIGESIIINHPFVDGNKRTGLLAIFELLHKGNLTVNSSKDELYQFVIDISTGEKRFDQIVEWLKQNTTTV